MPLQKRPRGRPPMPCNRIDSVTRGRKSAKALKSLRTKLCLQRANATYYPYRCTSTPYGCMSFRQTNRKSKSPRNPQHTQPRNVTPKAKARTSFCAQKTHNMNMNMNFLNDLAKMTRR